MKFSDVYRVDDLIVHLKEIHDYQSAFRETEIFKSFRNPPISFFSMSTFVDFKRWVGESEQLQSLAFLLSFHSSLIFGASGPSRIVSQEPGPLENFPIIPFQRFFSVLILSDFDSFAAMSLRPNPRTEVRRNRYKLLLVVSTDLLTCASAYHCLLMHSRAWCEAIPCQCFQEGNWQSAALS
ncbi:hypothetical protein HHK36_001675 [Tetracentron sinense]|uniref:Uncharacterized protein n=1 Tax=Tetracentron sinense TaxID=13715 RepID=A0A835DRC9_TETSI|nr:hypothetical protein HHK36_001675 [Tetracentron sinense]